MCDYSLEHIASRRAKVGDKLVSTAFDGTITRGFAAVGEPGVAVCLLPGTEVAFDEPVRCVPNFRFFPARVIRAKTAVFRQVDMDQPAVHHDALEFPDGRVVKVSQLHEGQSLVVLQLPAQPGGGTGGDRGEARLAPATRQDEPAESIVEQMRAHDIMRVEAR